MRGLVLGVVAAALVAAPARPAQAATTSCATVDLVPSSATPLGLGVSPVTVDKGGCVRFRNRSGTAATVRVRGTTYEAVIPAGGTTSRSADYTATSSVTVDAVSGLRSGSGTITVRAASPSPTSSASPSATASASPASTTSRPTPSTSRSHAGRPHKRKGAAKLSLPPLPPLPTSGASGAAAPSNPLVAPGSTSAGEPVVGTATVPAATVLDPVSSSKRGLPVVVAAAILVGLLCGFGRVVLFVPSPGRSPSGRRHRA